MVTFAMKRAELEAYLAMGGNVLDFILGHVEELEQRVRELEAAKEGGCERPGGCVCGGDLPAIRKGCGYYVS